MGGWRKIKLDIPVAKLVSAFQVNMDIPVYKASAEMVTAKLCG